MKILLISISAPPQNTPESLQVAKYAKGLAAAHEVTLVTIKGAGGWRKPDDTVKGYLDNVQVIELPHYTSRWIRFIFRLINKDWLKMPDEDFLFSRQWKKVVRLYNQKPDIIFSRSMPFSSALMGLALKEYYGVPWVMHLSDPWVKSPFFSGEGDVLRFHIETERACFAKADAITLTSHEQVDLYQETYPEFSSKVLFYPNVYDDNELYLNPFTFRDKLTFLHAGNFYGEGRSPYGLLEAIHRIVSVQKNYFENTRFLFVGRLNSDIKRLFRKYDFPFVEVIDDYSFNQSISLQRKAHVLLLFDWKFRNTKSVFFLSKILGYMAAQRPILAVTEKGSTCYKVIEGKYGKTFEHTDIPGLQNYLAEAVKNFNAKNFSFFKTAPADHEYSASFNSNRLAQLFQKLIDQQPDQKFDKVKEFFEKDTYLQNRVNIEVRKAIIRECFPSVTGRRVLDVGCGDGSLSMPFMDANQVVLLDAATQMIEIARKEVNQLGYQANATFVKDDILKYEDQDKFDIILCIGVISHIEDVNQLLNKINSLLKPDGRALIQFSDIDHFRYRLKRRFGKPDNYGYTLNTFNRPTFFKLTDAAGLNFVGEKGYFWQYPLMDRLKPSVQLGILNALRNKHLFSFLNTEWLVLFEKKKSAS